MARTTTALRDIVLAEGGFDSARWSTAAVGWLSDKHRQLIVRSRWKFADSFSLGTTTAGTATYTWPVSAVQFEWIEVAGVRYFYASPEAVDGLQDGSWEVASDDGFYTQAADATGATKLLRLFPTPTVSSLAITGKVMLSPADLDTSGSNPLTPDDMERPLIAGAIGVGKLMAHERPDLAAAFEATFQTDGVVELSKRVRSRGRTGPTAVAVKGMNFR